MAKYIICTGMGQLPTGLQEFVKEVTAHKVVDRDGVLFFYNHGDDLLAVFKQYVYVLDESQIPVIAAPVRSLRQ